MTDTDDTNNQDSNEVRALIERWAVASRIGDIHNIMACYTPDILAFDAIAKLQFKGAGEYRKHWQTCISYMPGGEMILEIHELDIQVGGNIAFAHYLSLCGAKDDKGNEDTGWMRATVCCQKTAAGWRICHEHYSVPFDPENMNAMSDLTP